MHGMSKNLINRSAQNVIIWNFIFSSRPNIGILSAYKICNVTNICKLHLLPEMKNEKIMPEDKK